MAFPVAVCPAAVKTKRRKTKTPPRMQRESFADWIQNTTADSAARQLVPPIAHTAAVKWVLQVVGFLDLAIEAMPSRRTRSTRSLAAQSST